MLKLDKFISSMFEIPNLQRSERAFKMFRIFPNWKITANNLLTTIAKIAH